MQKLIIFAAFVACSLAAPLETIQENVAAGHLSRPSPINPDIPSDPKPAEKVTLITDPKEKTLYQPKAISIPAELPGPYVVPSERLALSKRETKSSAESEEKSSEEDKKSSSPLNIPSVSPSTALPNKDDTKTSTTSTPISSTTDVTDSGLSTSSVGTVPRRPYSPLIHTHNEHLFKPSTDADTSASSSTTSKTTAVPSSPATFKDHLNEKRDIPVPLSRTYQHDDYETKKNEEPATAIVSKEEVNNEEKKDGDRKAKTTAHPVTISRPIPVAELFAKKPSTE